MGDISERLAQARERLKKDEEKKTNSPVEDRLARARDRLNAAAQENKPTPQRKTALGGKGASVSSTGRDRMVALYEGEYGYGKGGKFYSKPDLYQDAAWRYADVIDTEGALLDAQRRTGDAYAALEQAAAAMQKESGNRLIAEEYNKRLDDYKTVYGQYKTVADKYGADVDAYSDYMTRQGKQYDAWRSTVRPKDEVQGNVDSLSARIKELQDIENDIMAFNIATQHTPADQMPDRDFGGFTSVEEVREEIARLTGERDAMHDELWWAKAFDYEQVSGQEDFDSVVGSMVAAREDKNFWRDDFVPDFLQGDLSARNVVHAIQNGTLDSLREEYGFLTEDQQNILLYYAGRGEWDKASEYLEWAERSLNQQAAAAQQRRVEEFSAENPFWAAILAPGASVLGGIFGAADLAVQTVERGITGKPIDYNTEGFRLGSVGGQAVGTVSGIIEDSTDFEIGGRNVASMLYNTAASGANSLVAMGIPGGAIALAANATQARAKDLASRGASDNQALAGGLAAGIFEGLFEAFSIGNLRAMKEIPVTGLKSFALNIAKSAGVNASEEAATELANIVFDALAMGNVSDWQASINAYIDAGETPEEAKRKTVQDMFGQVIESAASGLLMGIGFGSIGSAQSAIYNSSLSTLEQAAQEVAMRGTISNNTAERIMADKSAMSQLGVDTSGMTKSQGRAAVREALTGQTPTQQTAPGTSAPVRQEAARPVSAAEASLRVEQGNRVGASLGVSGSRAFEAAYDESTASTLSVEDAFEGFAKVYNAALKGETVESNLPSHMKMAAESAGQNDALRAEQAAYFGEKAGVVRDANFQKAHLSSRNVRVLDAVAKVVGVQVRFANDVKDAGGASVNATYGNGVITVSLRSKMPVRAVFTHEIVHRIRETAPDAYNAMATFVRNNMSGKLQTLLGKAYGETYETTSVSEYTEEMVADAFGVMLNDSKVMEQFVQDNRKPAQKLLDAIRDLINAVKRALNGQNVKLSEAQRRAFLVLSKDLAGLERTLADALKTAGDSSESFAAAEISDAVAKRVENSEPVSAMDEVKASRKFDTKYMDAAEKKNNGRVKKEIMAEARRVRQAVADIFNDPELADSLGLPPDIIGNTYIPNGSYSGTEENSTVCIRSIAVDALMDAVAEHLGRPLTVEDTVAISQEYWKYTDKPECLYCYVAMDRKAYREFLGSYLQQRDDVLRDAKSGKWDTKTYTAEEFDRMSDEQKSKSLYWKFLDGRKPTKPMGSRFELWLKNADKEMVTPADLASYASMEAAMERNPALKEQINDAMKYAQSASWAKKRVSYAAYNNHILKWKQSRIDNLNSNYGLRMYSFSDFSPAFILENMQMITDAAVRGLKVLAYTKELDFVRIFAKTGMNINISVFGYDAASGVGMDAMQGADWAEAYSLRKKYPNVGITFVATNDSQIEWALEQDWIDVVIPFHLVRTGKRVASYFGWKDYTSMSSDTKKAGWTSENAKHILPPEHQNDKARYLAACEANNLTPRFVDWADRPGYMKLVNETRQSEGETQPVQPIFDLDAAKASIEEMRKRGGYYTPIGGSEENMRDIAGEIGDKIGGKKFSRDMEEALSAAEQMERNLNQLRQERDGIEDKLMFAEIDGLSAEEVKRLNSRLYKVNAEIDKIGSEERRATVKTSMQEILDNLGKYRRSDLESLALQISDDAWDDYDTLSRQDLEEGLRDAIQGRELSPLEMQSKKFGLWVRPVNVSASREIDPAKLKEAAKQAAKDAQLAGMMNQGRKDAKKLREQQERTDKVRQQRDQKIRELKAQQQERMAKRREQLTAKEYREKIERHVKDLSQKLLKPTDKRHVPEELRKAVATLLEAINLESSYTLDPDTLREVIRKDGKSGGITGKHLKDGSGLPTQRTKAALELKAAYQKAIKDDGSELVIDPSMEPLFDEVAAMSDVRLADMTSEQAKKVWDLIRMVERTISTAGKTLTKAKAETTTEWADKMVRDTATRKGRKGRAIEGLRLDMENPYTFFSHFGQAGMDVYRMLRDAQDHQQDMVSKLRDEVQTLVSAKEVRQFENEVHEYVTERGELLVLTSAHLMEIYELMKREQAQEHLVKGGIVQPEVKVKGRKIQRGNDAVLLTAEDLVRMIKPLTSEQMAIADAFQALTTGMLADWGNEASMQAYRYKKFTGEDYWPIHSASEGVHSNVEKSETNTRSIKNIGLAKNTVPHASNPLDIGGLFQTFAAHAADMTDYAAWLCPMEDANRLFNYEFRNSSGQRTGKSIKGLLDRVGGKGSQTYWKRLMEDIQNGISASNDTAVMPLINKLYGNTKSASVGANLRVIIQQPTAIFRAVAIMNPVDIAAGLVRPGGWKTALEHSPLAKRKDMGGFDISSPLQMGEMLYDNKSGLQKFNAAMMWGAGKADALTWGWMWKACEHAVKKANPKLSGEAFYEAVNKMFTDVIDQSQVVDGVMQRSQMMRSGNAWVKQATAFMGEPTMTANMLIRAWDQWAGESDAGKRSKAMKKFGRTLAALVATNAINALAQSLVDAARDDDEDKEYWERFWAAFTGVKGDEESAWEKAVAFVLTGNAGQGINPVGYIPFAKDALSILQGYNVTRADADAIGDVIKAVQTTLDSFSGGGSKTIPYALKELANQVGKVFGISGGNILRDVWGIMRSIAVATDNVAVQYEMEKAIYNIDSTGNNGRFIDILFRAYRGDPEVYERIYADMVANGITEDAIKKGMDSRLKKEAGVTSLTDLESRYLSPARQAEYDATMDGVKKSNLWASATADQRAAAADELYNMVVNTASGSKADAIVAGGEGVGFDETEYILYSLALAMYDKPNASGNLGTYTNDEVKAAIDATPGLTKREKAYLWEAAGKSAKTNPYK